MSSTEPPTEPRSESRTEPPSGPLRGPDRSFGWPAHESVGGVDPAAGPVVVEETTTGSRRGLGRGLVLGGAAALLALGGAGAWAWTALGGGGERPADALPATTFAYLAVDLDPAAGQKLEALRTLSKFPGLADQGVSEDKDLGTTLTDLLVDKGSCTNLDPKRDVSSWLGQRAAVAAVTVGSDSVPVGVVQVSDESAAGKGLLALLACSESHDAKDTSGLTPTWVLRDGWAYIAQDADTATRVADAADGTTLAQSRDFTEWTGKVGEQGLATVYLAPKPGAQIRSLVKSFDLGSEAANLDAVTAQYDSFQGGAATLRFADGGIELEAAGGLDDTTRGMLGKGVGPALSTLPDDTLAAVAVSPAKGWVDTQFAQAARGAKTDVEDFYSSIEKSTGLAMPEDLETLFGSATVLSLGGSFDPAAVDAGGPEALPLAAKIVGDPAGISRVVGHFASTDPSLQTLLAMTFVGDDTVIVGPSGAYRGALATGGKLGDSAAFRSVVPHADTAVVAFYLDVDGKDNWLANLAKDEPDVAKNLEPLKAVGLSVWPDGDTIHSRLRVTTD
ncbi:MAG: DUF3352 domain-containing protein [Micrococcales bacterium]|nr:DUF3352 domain-containing protein [Micrococcales bacterium]